MLSSLALLLVMAPGLYAWLKGKQLRNVHLQDPLLAERYQAYLTAEAGISLLCLLVATIFLHWSLAPLIIVSSLAGRFPLRRTLYGETWHFFSYLYFELRIFLAFSGLAWLIGFSPLLVALAGPWRWLEIGLLAGILLIWLSFRQQILLRLLGARPMADSELKGRLEKIAANSNLDYQPLLMVAALPGGRMANAFALPSTRQSVVLFTQPLLDALTIDQNAAIFAHELGHLEHMNKRFVWRRIMLMAITMTLALAMTPIAELLFGSSALRPWKMLLAGFGLMTVMVLALNKDRQQHETASDRRAVKLCGDAEVLAQALEHLHQLSLSPRRLKSETEQAATHPSLANRIKAIQEPGQPLQNSLTETVVLTSPSAERYVILENKRIHWLEGVPAETEPDAAVLRDAAASVSSFAYSELSELLLKPLKKSGARISATTRKGQKLSMPLADKDLALAQNTLNQIDGLLATDAKHSKTEHTLPVLLLVAGVLSASFSSSFNPWMYPVVFFLLYYPHLCTITVIAIMALCGELIALLQTPPSPDSQWSSMTAAFVLSAGLAYTVWEIRKSTISPSKKQIWLACLLWLMICIYWYEIVSLLLTDFDPLRLYQAALNFMNAAGTMFGMAGLIAIAGRSGRRTAPILLFVLAGISAVFIQSPYFGRHIAGDAFAGIPQNVPEQRATLQAVREIPLADYAAQLRLSADGNWFAYGDNTKDLYAGTHEFKLTDKAGNSTAFAANDLIFTDNLHLLRLNCNADECSLEWLQNREIAWQAQKRWHLPAMKTASLRFNNENSIWQVLEQTDENHRRLLISGRLDEAEVTSKEFPALPKNFRYAGAIIENNLLELKKDYSMQDLWTTAIAELYLDDGKQRFKLASTTNSFINCLSSLPGEEINETLCISEHLMGNRLTFLQRDTGLAEPLFQIPNSIYFHQSARQGQRVYFANRPNGIYRLDLSTRQATNLEFPDEQNFAAFAVAEPWLAITIQAEQGGYMIRLFKIP